MSSTGWPTRASATPGARTGKAPTDPTARRASATRPSATWTQLLSVAAGRSWKAKRTWAMAVAMAGPSGRAGTSTARSTSPGSRAVSYGPSTKLVDGQGADTVVLPSRTRAPAARRNVAGSECGSAKARLPPSEPVARTLRLATRRSIAARSGQPSPHQRRALDGPVRDGCPR